MGNNQKSTLYTCVWKTLCATGPLRCVPGTNTVSWVNYTPTESTLKTSSGTPITLSLWTVGDGRVSSLRPRWVLAVLPALGQARRGRSCLSPMSALTASRHWYKWALLLALDFSITTILPSELSRAGTCGMCSEHQGCLLLSEGWAPRGLVK